MGHHYRKDEVNRREGNIMSELKEKQNLWEFYFKREWSYTTGAVLLSLLAIALVLVTDHAWGVTGVFSIWGGKVLSWVGVNVDSWKPLTEK